MKYKLKKQDEIEAIEFTGQNSGEVSKWMRGIGDKKFYIDRNGVMVITAFHGTVFVNPDEYIIYDMQDCDYWKMDSEKFENTYKPV